ncbi:MAG TPA: hypothetical protein VGN16_25310 [Acidobacteriaceae bacterium]
MTVSYARSLTFCFFATTIAVLSGCNTSGVQAGGGSAADISGPPTFNVAYQARNPRVCSKVMSPPTPTQAVALVQCDIESDTTGGSTPLLTLTTAVHVEMGSPRNYIPGTDDRTEIDPRAKVYPIRGEGVMWQCFAASSRAAGQNCVNYPAVPKGTGICFKTTFHDWQCAMTLGGPMQVRDLKGPVTY